MMIMFSLLYSIYNSLVQAVKCFNLLHFLEPSDNCSRLCILEPFLSVSHSGSWLTDTNQLSSQNNCFSLYSFNAHRKENIASSFEFL
jgi:hypothetical protein